MKINTISPEGKEPNNMSDKVNLYHFDPSYYQLPPGEKQKLCRARALLFKKETNRRRQALEDKRKQLELQQQQRRDNVLQLRRQKLQEVTERFQRAHLCQAQRRQHLFRRAVPTMEEALVEIQSSLGSQGNHQLAMESNSPHSKRLPLDVTNVSSRTKTHVNPVQENHPRRCDPDPWSSPGSKVPQKPSPEKTVASERVKTEELPERRVRFIVGILKRDCGYERRETSNPCDSGSVFQVASAVRDSVDLTRARKKKGGGETAWMRCRSNAEQVPGSEDHHPSGTPVSGWTTPSPGYHFTKKADVGVPSLSRTQGSRIPQRAGLTRDGWTPGPSQRFVGRPQSEVTETKIMDSSRNRLAEQKPSPRESEAGFYLHGTHHTSATTAAGKSSHAGGSGPGPQNHLKRTGKEKHFHNINDKIPELWNFVHKGFVSSEGRVNF